MPMRLWAVRGAFPVATHHPSVPGQQSVTAISSTVRVAGSLSSVGVRSVRRQRQFAAQGHARAGVRNRHIVKERLAPGPCRLCSADGLIITKCVLSVNTKCVYFFVSDLTGEKWGLVGGCCGAICRRKKARTGRAMEDLLAIYLLMPAMQ
jgi:hypothetical protein